MANSPVAIGLLNLVQGALYIGCLFLPTGFGEGFFRRLLTCVYSTLTNHFAPSFLSEIKHYVTLFLMCKWIWNVWVHTHWLAAHVEYAVRTASSKNTCSELDIVGLAMVFRSSNLPVRICQMYCLPKIPAVTRKPTISLRSSLEGQ